MKSIGIGRGLFVMILFGGLLRVGAQDKLVRGVRPVSEILDDQRAMLSMPVI